MKCASCRVEKQYHCQRWTSDAGWHGWIEPPKELIAKRLRKKYGLK